MTELTLKADRRLTAERGRDTHFVWLSFRAPLVETHRERPGLNLSLVLDRSGSMKGQNKLSLAKRATDLALARLTSRDRFSLVVYDDVVQVLVHSTPATAEALNEARRGLRGVVAGASTALFDGYLRGAEQVAEQLGEGDVGKVLLLTDGLANVGLQDPAAIIKHVAELRARGVHTSTFGVGADFNQLLLDGMADAGGGSFYFVESATELEDLLTSEVGESLEAVAREVRVGVEHSKEVNVRPLDAFVEVPQNGGVMSRLGSLTSEQLVELLYEVDLPGRPAGEVSSVWFAVSDADGVLGNPKGVVEFRHASDAEVEAEQPDPAVLREAAQRVRLEAGERAYALNYEGRRGEVRQEASKALEYLRRLAEKNPDVAALVAELEQDVTDSEKVMNAIALKMMYFQRSRLRRGRDAAGKAVKEPK